MTSEGTDGLILLKQRTMWQPEDGITSITRSMKQFPLQSSTVLADPVPAPTGTTEKKKYYRIQLGAFSVKSNADAMLKKVKAAGFTDAFIKYGE